MSGVVKFAMIRRRLMAMSRQGGSRSLFHGNKLDMGKYKNSYIKSGFTLIELLIATAIASILSISLFYSYGQTNKAVTYITDYVDTYNKIILLDRRFSQDVAGVFIPVQAIKKQKPQSEKKPEDKKDDAIKQPQKKEGEKQKAPLLKDPFVSKNENKNLKMFSFITNNPARAYWSSKSGEPRPNIARVVYTLEADKSAPKEKPRFTLYRQEGADLSLVPYVAQESQIERYVIVDNIQACNINFLVTDEKENASEVKEFNDWQIAKDEKDLRSKAKIPETVVLEISLWNNEYSNAKNFTIVVPVAAKFTELPAQEPEQKKPGAGQTGQKKLERKEFLVSSANKVVDNIRGLYRT
jgi:prepilin-type N-terminal cleavage/methylation domain-containing protein